MTSPDTIFALSSGALPSGVAIVRLSGPHVSACLKQLIGALPESRSAAYRSIRSRKELILDRGLVLFFPGPASFTGEDCAELHLHGGRAVVSAVLQELGQFHGLRQAEAGEFTKRAFLNGKVDLVEAEALADLVQAETEAQRRFAVANTLRSQSYLYEAWRVRLVHARAMIEAELDFADEGDVPGSVSAQVWADIKTLVREIADHIAGYRRAEIVRDGFRVVILGAPNAGKSSLLNALAQRDVAIVTDEPGTTRDLIEIALDLDGYKVLITDTAGIRKNAGTVESIGIKRALEASDSADLALLLVEPGGSVPDVALACDRLIVGSKVDLGGVMMPSADIQVSATTGDGLGNLLQLIGVRAATAAGAAGEVLPSRLRHVDLLLRCQRALEGSLLEKGLELRAEDLRTAADELGRISGKVDAEELLGVIFSNFCIGK